MLYSVFLSYNEYKEWYSYHILNGKVKGERGKPLTPEEFAHIRKLRYAKATRPGEALVVKRIRKRKISRNHLFKSIPTPAALTPDWLEF